MNKRASIIFWTAILGLIIGIGVIYFAFTTGNLVSEEKPKKNLTGESGKANISEEVKISGEPFGEGNCLVYLRDSEYIPWTSWDFVSVDNKSKEYLVITRTLKLKDDLNELKIITQIYPESRLEGKTREEYIREQVLESFGPKTKSFEELNKDWLDYKGYVLYEEGCPDEYTYPIL